MRAICGMVLPVISHQGREPDGKGQAAWGLSCVWADGCFHGVLGAAAAAAFFGVAAFFTAGLEAALLAAGFLTATVLAVAGFLAGAAFFTAGLAAALLAAGFLAATVLAVAGFLAGAAFFTAGLAAALLATGFFAAADLTAVAFFAGSAFFAAGFLAVAMEDLLDGHEAKNASGATIGQKRCMALRPHADAMP